MTPAALRRLRLLTRGLAALMFLLPAFARAEPFALRPGVPVHLLADEPEALRIAVEDLRRDLLRQFGEDSPLIMGIPAPGTPAIVVLGPAAASLPGWEVGVEGVEAHRVALRTLPDGSGNALITGGTDLRGAIYAVYTLSEEILGVPPMWLWTSWQPEPASMIPVPAGLDIRHPSPHTRWRAWFPNDQDYLEPWKRRDPRNRELLAETMLRLKLNAWDTGSVLHTNLRRLTDDAAMGARRGLAVMSTHTSPLGARIDATRWRAFWAEIRGTSIPDLHGGDPAHLREYWSHVIDTVAASGIETIWTLTFRADRDLPFWRMYGNAPETDGERAALITRFIDLQRELVEQRVGPGAWMRIPLYNEMSDYAIAGLMNLPRGPRIIWNFVAARRDHYPPIGIEDSGIPPDQPIGLYYNIQFTSTGSHVVAGEGPWKMEANYRFMEALQPGPLVFSLVNSGNTREFPLELTANARLVWDPAAYDSDRFLLEFCRKHAGPEHAAAAAELTRAYFQAYWEQRTPTRPGFNRQFIFQDLRYMRAIRDLLRVLETGALTHEPFRQPEFFMIDPAHSGTTSTLAALIAGTVRSGHAFAAVAAEADLLLPKLPERHRTFFNDSLRVPAHTMAQLNATLDALARAADARPDSRQRHHHTVAAHQAFSRARAFLAETEHGPFTGWYPRADQRDLAHLNAITARLEQLVAGRRR